MALVKGVLLVDGENLVMRYQAMLKDGRQPADGVVHWPDVFVWHHKLPSDVRVDLLRIMYYTSVVGAEDKISEISEFIAQHLYHGRVSYYGPCQLYPCVYKKPAQSTKSRLVDINIAIEVMR